LADQDWIGQAIFKNFADQDWIGFNFIGSGLDSDWKISQSAHLWRTWSEVTNFTNHDFAWQQVRQFFKFENPTLVQTAAAIHPTWNLAEVRMNRIRIGYPAEYLRFFRIRIGFRYTFLKNLDQDRIRIFVWFLRRNFLESDSRCHKWWW